MDSANDDHVEIEVGVGQRKTRAAAKGVAELMRNLKPKKKGTIDKGKNKQNKVGSTTLGGQLTIPSS